MTKMATMPIYGKTLQNNLQNRRADIHETWYVASGIPANYSLFKLWPLSDLDLFYGEAKFGNIGFSVGKKRIFQKLCSL